MCASVLQAPASHILIRNQIVLLNPRILSQVLRRNWRDRLIYRHNLPHPVRGHNRLRRLGIYYVVGRVGALTSHLVALLDVLLHLVDLLVDAADVVSAVRCHIKHCRAVQDVPCVGRDNRRRVRVTLSLILAPRFRLHYMLLLKFNSTHSIPKPNYILPGSRRATVNGSSGRIWLSW